MKPEEIRNLSDGALNCNIAKKLGIFHSESCFGKVLVWESGMALGGEVKDYCNNWNDLMPLVDFNYEFRETHTGRFHCLVLRTTIGTGKSTQVKQRALAECLLQVLIAKGE
ncbi:MAG: hypothetical protein K0U78_14920 [Actinomycetia bacterium]|nr:hypothetical protein [Actinomycetes bacterium]